MKRIVSWIVVLAVTIAICAVLFVTGKQHKIMLVNGNAGEKVPARVSYIVDGENADKPKSVRANKKGVAYVKGSNHTITIKFKDGGQNKEITKKFKAKISKDTEINFAGIINDTPDWIVYSEKAKEAPTGE